MTTNLMRASRELFRRSPDECFPSLDVLQQHFLWQKQESREIWQPPRLAGRELRSEQRLMLDAGDDGAYRAERLELWPALPARGSRQGDGQPADRPTAARRLRRDPAAGPTSRCNCSPLGGRLRSIHAGQLHPAAQRRTAGRDRGSRGRFPAAARRDSTGQPASTAASRTCSASSSTRPAGPRSTAKPFAPGFFVWNSEVGCRSLGIQTFWFQAICQNHIVWDAVEVVEFSRKHTANVHEALDEIRRAIETLVRKRDERRDGFCQGHPARRWRPSSGDDAEEVQKVLSQNGIPADLAKEAIDIAQAAGPIHGLRHGRCPDPDRRPNRQRRRTAGSGPEGGQVVDAGRVGCR